MPKSIVAPALILLATSPVSASTLVASAEGHPPAPPARTADAMTPAIDFGATAGSPSRANAFLAEAQGHNLVLENVLQSKADADLAQSAGAPDALSRLALAKPRAGSVFPFASLLGLILLSIGVVAAIMRRRRLVQWFSRGAQPPRFSRSGGRSRRRSGRRRH